MGQVVLDGFIETNQDHFNLDLAGLRQGIYFLVLSGEEDQFTGRVAVY
jgi:hypothetical protein